MTILDSDLLFWATLFI